jgi:hypothetical protein
MNNTWRGTTVERLVSERYTCMQIKCVQQLQRGTTLPTRCQGDCALYHYCKYENNWIDVRIVTNIFELIVFFLAVHKRNQSNRNVKCINDLWGFHGCENLDCSLLIYDSVLYVCYWTTLPIANITQRQWEVKEIQQWNIYGITGKGKSKYLKKTLLQRHFVR